PRPPPHPPDTERVRPSRGRSWGPPAANEERPRVDGLTAEPPSASAHHHLEMEVPLAPSGISRRPDETDHLRADETAAGRDPPAVRLEVCVVIDEALRGVRGVQRDAALAIATEPKHAAVVRRDHRGAAR